MIKAPSAKLFIIFIVYIILASSILTIGHDWGDDFSAYIMQAASLIQGELHNFIEENTFTIQESSRVLGPVIYPWGYPLLIAPIYAAFGLNLMAFKAVSYTHLTLPTKRIV